MTSTVAPAPDLRAARTSIAERALDVARALLAEIHASDTAGAAVTLDSSLEEHLRLDSLSRAELLVRLERAFAVDLPEDVLEQVATLRDLVEAIENRVGAAGKVKPAADRIALAQPVPGRGPTGVATADRGVSSARLPVPQTILTLVDAFRWHRDNQPEGEQIRHLAAGAQSSISHRALWEAAESIAGGLQAVGFEPGETASIMLPTGPEYFQVFLGVLLAGGIPVPIYPPTRAAQLVEHIQRHGGILDNARASVLIADRQTWFAAQLLRARARSIRFVLTPGRLRAAAGAYRPVVVSADDIALIQYTSGSTGDPKGVVLTHANLLANIRAMGALVQPRPDDVFVSWLPLYHDMGLIGAWFGSMVHAMPLVVMSPLAFLSRPARWLQVMHEQGGTISAAPNFAFELCVRRIEDADLERARVDLSRWRLAFNGAEAVLPETIRRFAERFARFGLRREALTPVYGLAESSVGLAFPPLGRGPWIDRIDRDAFTRLQRAAPLADASAAALEFVSCGRTLPGHALRVVDQHGNVLPARTEGRIEFQGPSAARGYFHNPQASAGLIRDGWLDTGDRGYLAEDELFVTGRVKDIIIRAGRNLYPHEIEAAVGEVDGVRKGCVAVFGRRDETRATERLVVVAETRVDDGQARERLAAAIGAAVIRALGEPADEIVLAAPHAVLKTSSGKIRRAATRDALAPGPIADRAATVPIARPASARASSRIDLALFAARTLLQRWVTLVLEWLYALYAWSVFVPIALVAWTLVVSTTPPARAWRIVQRAIRLSLRLTGIRVNATGLGHLPVERPFVLVANHASYLDGAVLAAAIPVHLVFVAKREFHASAPPRLFLSALGAQFVERFAATDSVRDTDRLLEVVSHGARLALFPEGTFTRATTLRPLRLGAFLIAARARVPIVPVSIRGTRSVLGAYQWLPRRSTIEITIGAPISTIEEIGGSAFAHANALRRQVLRFLIDSGAD